MFEWAKDFNGAPVCIPMPMYIPAATAIELGEIVKFTPGTGIVVVAGTDFDDPAVGVAVEAHDGVTTSGLGRQNKTELLVSTSPSAVYKLKSANIITATGGSTTTFVVSGLLPQTDDIWNGGMLEIVTCAADASLIGRRIKITDCTGGTGTLTFAAQGAAFASGDTARLCPGRLAIGSFGWDLTSDGTDVDWDTSGGEALQLVEVDPANMITYWTLRLHQFAKHMLAL
jgi:hypothetical protein